MRDLVPWYQAIEAAFLTGASIAPESAFTTPGGDPSQKVFSNWHLEPRPAGGPDEVASLWHVQDDEFASVVKSYPWAFTRHLLNVGWRIIPRVGGPVLIQRCNFGTALTAIRQGEVWRRDWKHRLDMHVRWSDEVQWFEVVRNADGSESHVWEQPCYMDLIDDWEPFEVPTIP